MDALDIISEVMDDMAARNPESAELLREATPRVEAMLQSEDVGWSKMFSGAMDGGEEGPSLDKVKEFSDLSREMALGSPLIARGLDLRTSYVWSKGITIEGAPEATSSVTRRGPKSAEEKFFTSKSTQRYLLSSEAHKDMESSAYNDGHYFLLGDDKTKSIHPIPFKEIDSVCLSEDYNGEAVAYRRTWTHYPTLGGQGVEKSEWYYVYGYEGARTNPDGASPASGITSTVNKEKTLFVKVFNTFVGWALGTPDTLPALSWARAYAEMVSDGRVVSKANAKFVYKAKAKTAAGARDAAAKASNSKGVGNIAGLGNENDLVSIPQSNRAYDFNGLRPIAAQVATALNVSVVHILSDPGAAGSSYGSASNLDLPTKRAMVSRQSEWVGFIQDVLKWGTKNDYNVSFPTLDDPDPYREMQLVTMAWNSGLIHEDEARDKTLSVGGVTPLHDKAPKGVMLPNNEASLPRSDVDTDAVGGSDASGSVPSTAKSPDQGTRNGTGGVSDSTAKDLRTEALHDEVAGLREQIATLAAFLENRVDQ